jgi:iron complex transport system substrate-binding protein
MEPFAMPRANQIRAAFSALAVLSIAGPLAAAPRAVSINLCTDQLLLELADSDQILSLSWLSADPEESMLPLEASRYRLNYGTAEEVLALDPDVVLAGAYTGRFTRRLLERLGYAVAEVAPANTLAEIERNLRQVAAAIGQVDRGEDVIRDFRARQRTLVPRTDGLRVAFLRPGGFTIDPQSLTYELIERAGIRNVASEGGLDRWGSLPMEALVRTAPDVIIVSRYDTNTVSLADGVLEHPALRAAAAHAQIVHVPTRYWACGLPQSLDAIALLLDAIAGDARHPTASTR